MIKSEKVTPLHRGLSRPAKMFGLPINYFVLVTISSVIPMLVFDRIAFLLVGIVCYPAFWLLADKHPRLVEKYITLNKRTPTTQNFFAKGFDRYVS